MRKTEWSLTRPSSPDRKLDGFDRAATRFAERPRHRLANAFRIQRPAAEQVLPGRLSGQQRRPVDLLSRMGQSRGRPVFASKPIVSLSNSSSARPPQRRGGDSTSASIHGAW